MYKAGDVLISKTSGRRIEILRVISGLEYVHGDRYVMDESGGYLLEYQLRSNWHHDREYMFYKELRDL